VVRETRQPGADASCAAVGLFNRKSNLGPLCPAVGPRIQVHGVAHHGRARTPIEDVADLAVISAKESSETWFVTARTWPKQADTHRQAETLAGLHAEHVLFVLDESGSIPQAVMATAEAVLATGADAKIVQAGNPTTLDGPLYRACVTEEHLWSVVSMTGDPDDQKRSPRVSLEWARQQIATYGRDNPWGVRERPREVSARVTQCVARPGGWPAPPDHR
jgi:hypothetical protein